MQSPDVPTAVKSRAFLRHWTLENANKAGRAKAEEISFKAHLSGQNCPVIESRSE